MNKNIQVCEICNTTAKELDYPQFLREVALGHCTAISFEVAIQKFGLTMEMIAIISEYYKNDFSKDEKQFAFKICGGQ